jgi:hypothetical protein
MRWLLRRLLVRSARPDAFEVPCDSSERSIRPRFCRLGSTCRLGIAGHREDSSRPQSLGEVMIDVVIWSDIV